MASISATRQLPHNQSINQSIYLMSWGGNWDPTDKKSSHTDKICFLHAKHSLRKPPHAFGSHKVIKSAIVQQCCRRSNTHILPRPETVTCMTLTMKDYSSRASRIDQWSSLQIMSCTLNQFSTRSHTAKDTQQLQGPMAAYHGVHTHVLAPEDPSIHIG